MGISGGGNVFLVFDLYFFGFVHPTTFVSFGKGVIGGKLITLPKKSFILTVFECLELLALLEWALLLTGFDSVEDLVFDFLALLTLLELSLVLTGFDSV